MNSDCSQLRWFALRVKARHEKNIAWVLRQKGYEEFLPLYHCERKWSDRMKQLELPLFPGYVFCRFDPRHRLPILTTPGVALIVGNGKTPEPVEDQEIEVLQAVVHSRLSAQPWPFLQVGQRVRIVRGALCGLEGLLVDFRKSLRLVVSVTLLQRSVAVEVDQEWVRPVSHVSIGVPALMDPTGGPKPKFVRSH
ncbi:MAG: transcription termination/antitermination protein NusG [Bryobacteraceae bacterium]